MKLIFLDFDGVLNDKAYIRENPDRYNRCPLDPNRVLLLNRLVELTGAMVVISSAWRADGIMKCKDLLHAAGYKGHIRGVTPSFEGCNRHEEITAFITEFKERGNIDQYVILDDAFDAMIPNQTVLIEDGMTEIHMLIAHDILMRST